MRKVIAAINMSLDGICDHTVLIADEELHRHYTELIQNSGAILYGRITYHLMEYWRTVAANPTGEMAMDEFAIAMDSVPKIVFSNTLESVDWASARLSTKDLREEVLELRKQPGKDILVGSRSLIVALLNLGLVDEFQLVVQPILVAEGMRLFENVDQRINLKLLRTKTFSNLGSVVFYFEPAPTVYPA
jgi:dihydrofolate reductase